MIPEIEGKKRRAIDHLAEIGKKSYGSIDQRVRLLVRVLNLLPGITTYASCGGHKRSSGRLNPTPEGEFYVSFATLVDPDYETEQSLSIIKKAIEKFNGKCNLQDDTIEEGFSQKSGFKSCTITGKEIHPKILAKTIQEEKKNNQIQK